MILTSDNIRRIALEPLVEGPLVEGGGVEGRLDESVLALAQRAVPGREALKLCALRVARHNKTNN